MRIFLQTLRATSGDSLPYTFKRSLPIIWVVGGSGELGLTVSATLQSSQNIVCISRSSKKSNEENYLHFPLDLADEAAVQASLEHLKKYYFPRGIVFCQRYRISQEFLEFDMKAALNTDLLSPLRMVEETCSTSERERLSIVLISSVAGYLIHSSVPFWYHWLKSSQIQLVKYYSQIKRSVPFNINCIAPGTFLKTSYENYPEHYRIFLDTLQGKCAPKRVCTIQDIAHTIEYLISDKATCINGQTITLDGGLSNRMQEDLIQYDEKK